ncbi:MULTISPECIES: hypothetical protein [unclassified Sinorhizobium]|uniref:WYL domain-containing protein n=1 Tax=unclassified Sinorhizobium TaxID=2613772 RepID=UPI0035233D60
MTGKHDPIDALTDMLFGKNRDNPEWKIARHNITIALEKTGGVICAKEPVAWTYVADRYTALHTPLSTASKGDEPPLTFVYRNWRGEIATRTVRPIRLEYGATDWHPEPQWLLIAWDIEKDAERSFAVKDINPRASKGDDGGDVERLRNAIWVHVGECIAGMTHEHVSPHARRRIEAAILAAIASLTREDETTPPQTSEA